MALHHFKKIISLSEGREEKDSYNSNCSHNHNICICNSSEIESINNCTNKRQYKSRKIIDIGNPPPTIPKNDIKVIDPLNCNIDDKKDRSRTRKGEDECRRRGGPVLLHGVSLGEVMRVTVAEELRMVELENSQSCLRFGGS